MPWKERYTVSDERTIERVQWPHGRRCAASIVIDLSPPGGPAGLTPDDLDSDAAHYGLQVALPRMLDLLARHGMRATFAVPGLVAQRHGALVRRLLDGAHEVAAHGLAHEALDALERHEEAWRLSRATTLIAEAVGEMPRGWYTLPRQTDPFPGGSISEHTVDLLIDAGYEYLGNSEADDIPHWWVTRFEDRRAMLAMPYCYHYDDQYFIEFPPFGQGGNHLERPDALWNNWCSEFDAMAGSGTRLPFGRMFSMVVHPWLNGWGQRLDLLDRMLARIASSGVAWNPTALECARWWRGAYPKDATLRLEPSTWTDHPGSQG